MATDWSGHIPGEENWQLQFSDGTVVHRIIGPSDFTDKEQALEVAKELSEEWQTPILVKQTA